MNSHKNTRILFSNKRQKRCFLLLLIALVSSRVWADDCSDDEHGPDWAVCNIQAECTYRINAAESLFVSQPIDVQNQPGLETDLDWTYITNNSSEASCVGVNRCINDNNCLGGESEGSGVAVNTSNNSASLNGTAVGETPDNGCFTLTAIQDGATVEQCSRNYKIQITDNVSGWGDPHITTIGGVRYDFQSAGEFIALRGKDIELQTRQTPISTSHVPGKNAYTEIASCVSIYTAVAVRVGNHRVTIQPNLNGEPDPDGMEIRVDGELRSLGPNGINLSSCNCPADEIKSSGRVVRSADEQSIEIHSSDATNIVVTPAWWRTQEKWYLHVNVFDTTASEGIMGRVVDRWLPSLSDGDTVGPKSANIDERYKQLYETFADSWRVSDESSLFDYAENTSTDSFTVKEWPRFKPNSCLLEAEPLAVAIEGAAARAACSNVVNEDNRGNCVFDVMETGHLGFADAYERAEQVTPGATRTFLVQDEEDQKTHSKNSFTARVQRSVSRVGKINSGFIQFVLDGENSGDPIKFDDNRNATWRASDISRGTHELEARYIPSGFGERFRPSSTTVKFEY